MTEVHSFKERKGCYSLNRHAERIKQELLHPEAPEAKVFHSIICEAIFSKHIFYCTQEVCPDLFGVVLLDSGCDGGTKDRRGQLH